ncbi:MAG: ADP-ribosylglycohydrolase family protein [Clostridia bacterium]|nr:ADP-ribosylglycohydrolase family protein [Clostridia bacterium]
MNGRRDVLKDRFLGCLLAGAAGDALGYAVEFTSYKGIIEAYGHPGITAYELDRRTGTAIISDDTQMTLFTAAGLLEDAKAPMEERSNHTAHQAIYHAYLDWLHTQNPYGADRNRKLLLNDERLYALRAPGNTCLSALRSGQCGDMDNPINNSKGCGGVMRTAPVGLMAGEDADEAKILELGALAAAITHGHPLGYLPSAMFSLIVYRLAYAQENEPLDAVVTYVCDVMEEEYAQDPACASLLKQVNHAQRLAGNGLDDLQNIRELGEGWVGDEALVIALYCALRHEDSITDTLVAAVNHSGDSDSTGAIAGNILGAKLGASAIEEKFLRDLEMKELIEDVALRMLDAALPEDA